MKLPRWFPEVPRPWNPAFRSTWDAMSKPERQASMLFDVVIMVILVLGVLILSGCQRGPDTLPSPDEVSRDALKRSADQTRRETGLPIVVDPENGCQYIGLSNHGLTPRLNEYGKQICVKEDKYVQ